MGVDADALGEPPRGDPGLTGDDLERFAGSACRRGVLERGARRGAPSVGALECGGRREEVGVLGDRWRELVDPVAVVALHLEHVDVVLSGASIPYSRTRSLSPHRWRR